MILFLDLASNRKGAINENYGRELMELFTLGADRGAYTETDVRELARSLSGWDYDWSDSEGVHNFHWDEQNRWDPGYKTVFGKTGRWTWEDAARMVRRAPASTRRSSSASSGATSSRPRPTPAPPPSSRRSTSAPATRSARCSRRSCARRSCTRGRGWSSRRPSSSPACCARASAGSPPTRGTGSSPAAASVLYYPPDVSGWDDKHWLDTNTVLGRWEAVVDGARQRHGGARLGQLPGGDAGPGARQGAATSGAAPTLTSGGVAALDTFARSSIPANAAPLAARAAPERAAPADRRLPRLPDAAEDHGLPLQRLLARPGRPTACAASSRACPRPPAPASAAAPSSRVARRSRCRCTAARCCRGWRSRRASPGRPPGPPTGARLDLPRRRRRLASVLAPIGDARYSSLRPTLGLAPSGDAADAFTEDDRLHWHPASRRCATLHGDGKVSGDAGRSATTTPNQSHFTSRHYWEVGEVNPFGRIGWLGRYLDQHGVADNPLQGLSLDCEPGARAGRVERAGRRRRRAPTTTPSTRRDVWDAGRAADAATRSARWASRPPTTASSGRPRGAATRRPSACAASSPASRRPRRRRRGRLPEHGRLRAPARGARRDARRWGCR